VVFKEIFSLSQGIGMAAILAAAWLAQHNRS
jgi:drug/metabolite transporter (DMT)-like permease